MMQDFFKGSWRPKIAGILLVLWECYHEGCAYIGHTPIGGRNVVKALLIGIALWFVRENGKSSEDVGLKPNAINTDEVKKLVTDVVLGAGGKLVLLFGLALTCHSVMALNIAPIDIKPEAVDIKPDAVHMELKPNAVSIATTGHVDSGAVRVEGSVAADAVHAMVSPGAAVVQTGAFMKPLVTSEIDVNPDAVSIKPGAFVVTTSPKTINIEIDPGAIVVHAEGITDAATKPMAQIEAKIEAAGGKAEFYAIYFAGACCAIVCIVCIVWYFHMQRLKREHAAEMGTRA